MTSKRGHQSQFQFRSLAAPRPAEDDSLSDSENHSISDSFKSSDSSPHFLSALQVMAHVLGPLRRALIHFYFTCKDKTFDDSRIAWKFLQELGKLLKELISSSTRSGSGGVSGSFDEDDDSDKQQLLPPVNPKDFYKVLNACLRHFKKTTQPRDATEALRILLETVQQTCRTLPVTSHLWSNLLDISGMGLVAKMTIVGRCDLVEDGEILQRTQKESCIEWCPVVLPIRKTLEEALKDHCSRKPFSYDFDKKPYHFEVRIPLLAPASDSIEELDDDTSNWKTTRTLQWSSLTSYLFLAIDRLDKDGNFHHDQVFIPHRLDVTKLCDKSAVKDSGTKEYELVGGILHDEGDYVALLKNVAVTDPEDEEAWKLMESEEIIPMTQSDALEFLKGDGGAGAEGNDEDAAGAPSGTVLVYQRCDDQTEMKQILSDIILSQVSGTLNAEADYYYEEEIIED